MDYVNLSLSGTSTVNKSDLFKEITASYTRHGWKLISVLLKPQTRGELEHFLEVPVKESAVDALWFSRPSSESREAWELRLLAENQYALFETFELDEPEDEREAARIEMEARLREKVFGGQRERLSS